MTSKVEEFQSVDQMIQKGELRCVDQMLGIMTGLATVLRDAHMADLCMQQIKADCVLVNGSEVTIYWDSKTTNLS